MSGERCFKIHVLQYWIGSNLSIYVLIDTQPKLFSKGET